MPRAGLPRPGIVTPSRSFSVWPYFIHLWIIASVRCPQSAVECVFRWWWQAVCLWTKAASVAPAAAPAGLSKSERALHWHDATTITITLFSILNFTKKNRGIKNNNLTVTTTKKFKQNNRKLWKKYPFFSARRRTRLIRWKCEGRYHYQFRQSNLF